MDFQTPPWCCDYMVSLVNQEKCLVLEPTPGLGNLVRVLEKHQHSVVAPEDFWELSYSRYDYIVMNPPFTPMQLGYDILGECMEWSDNIIALMPWLTIINSSRRTETIVNFGLKSITHLPRKVFPGSRVQCCILNMEKSYNKKTELYFIEESEHGSWQYITKP